MLNAPHVITHIFGAAPWLMRADAIHGLSAQALLFAGKEPKLTAVTPMCRDAAGKQYPRKGEDWSGSCDMPGMSIADGVADIPIYGTIGNNLSPLAKWYFDATDLMDVQAEVKQAQADPTVKAILFSIDSPGGSSRNVPETGDMLGATGKPTCAWVDGTAASAAYWLAACAGPIYATRGSDMGSIGAYSVFYDKSQMYAAAGIKPEVFGSGKYKGARVPGTSLTPAQSAYIQADVDAVAEEFKATVRQCRSGKVPEECMQGQCMPSPKAAAAGLIDGMMRDKCAMLAACRLR